MRPWRATLQQQTTSLGLHLKRMCLLRTRSLDLQCWLVQEQTTETWRAWENSKSWRLVYIALSHDWVHTDISQRNFRFLSVLGFTCILVGHWESCVCGFQLIYWQMSTWENQLTWVNWKSTFSIHPLMYMQSQHIWTSQWRDSWAHMVLYSHLDRILRSHCLDGWDGLDSPYFGRTISLVIW